MYKIYRSLNLILCFIFLNTYNCNASRFPDRDDDRSISYYPTQSSGQAQEDEEDYTSLISQLKDDISKVIENPEFAVNLIRHGLNPKLISFIKSFFYEIDLVNKNKLLIANVVQNVIYTNINRFMERFTLNLIDCCHNALANIFHKCGLKAGEFVIGEAASEFQALLLSNISYYAITYHTFIPNPLDISSIFCMDNAQVLLSFMNLGNGFVHEALQKLMHKQIDKLKHYINVSESDWEVIKNSIEKNIFEPWIKQIGETIKSDDRFKSYYPLYNHLLTKKAPLLYEAEKAIKKINLTGRVNTIVNETVKKIVVNPVHVLCKEALKPVNGMFGYILGGCAVEEHIYPLLERSSAHIKVQAKELTNKIFKKIELPKLNTLTTLANVISCHFLTDDIIDHFASIAARKFLLKSIELTNAQPLIVKNFGMTPEQFITQKKSSNLLFKTIYYPASLILKGVYKAYNWKTNSKFIVNTNKQQQHISLNFENMSRTEIYDKGVSYMVDKDYKSALLCFEHAANRNHSEAQYKLGMMHLHGEGTSRNIVLGRQWIHKAAKNGYKNAIYAIFQLGRALFNDEKYEEGFEEFKQAADLGHAEAQFQVGLLYEKGVYGIAKNDDLAQEWFKKAYENGYEEAGKHIKKCLIM